MYTNNNQIIEELKKYHKRYDNKFKSANEFWNQYYIELNRLLQEKDGWTQKAIDEASFNSYLNNHVIHGKKESCFCKEKTNQANYL